VGAAELELRKLQVVSGVLYPLGELLKWLTSSHISIIPSNLFENSSLFTFID
jgi:hypothetical protein